MTALPENVIIPTNMEESVPVALPLETLQQYLSEARAAYHRLMTGTSAVSFKDQNGEMVTYQTASAARLIAYIANLEAQIAALTGQRTSCGPLRVTM